MRQEQKLKVRETIGKPVIVDVYARQGCDGVEFSHEWRLEDQGSKKPGAIEVPAANGETPMHFQLHDESGLNLRFVDSAQDAMWVSRGTCPRRACTDEEIQYDKPPAAKLLKVGNRNSEECTLNFALNFKSDAGPQCYDPEIKNGVRTVIDI